LTLATPQLVWPADKWRRHCRASTTSSGGTSCRTTRSLSSGGRGSRRSAAPGVLAGGVGAADPPAAGRAGGLAVCWRSLTRRPARRRVPRQSGGSDAARVASRSSYASGESETPWRPSQGGSFNDAAVPRFRPLRCRSRSSRLGCHRLRTCRRRFALAAHDRHEAVARLGRLALRLP
jgi:hypothetical protein